MKKILIAIGFIILGTNLQAMQNEQNQSKQTNKIQLSNKDKKKIGAAALGCALFSYICLTSYPTAQNVNDHLDDKDHLPPIHYLPAAAWMMLQPIAVLLLPYYLDKDNESLIFKTAYCCSGITSGILAATLGTYVYKKLSQLKRVKKSQKLSKGIK